MGGSEWQVPVGDTRRTVALNHDADSGAVSVTIDGQPASLEVVRKPGSLDRSCEYSFGAGGREYRVHVIEDARGFKYDLSADGISLTTGKAVEGSPGLFPFWVFLFIVPCVVLVFLGGAIGGGLGGGAAAGCYSIAMKKDVGTGVKLAICLALTIGCWFGWLVIAGGVHVLLG